MPTQGRRGTGGRQVRSTMRAQMRGTVRAQTLTGMARRTMPDKAASGARRAACLRLLETYADLARHGEHLLASLLAGQSPRQWAHYPADDAIDPDNGFQWFYHSHASEDRTRSGEHGHIHLFAQKNAGAIACDRQVKPGSPNCWAIQRATSIPGICCASASMPEACPSACLPSIAG